MANNHMGDLAYGKEIIKEFNEVTKNYTNGILYQDYFDFAFKFQFRDLDTFIHKDYKDRDDLKYVKRFKETKLTGLEFLELKDYASELGFLTICTAFDENSVDMIEELCFDYIKIGSCSLTDWPLINRILETNLPIIASTAGSTLNEIDDIVSTFQNRNKEFSLLHCVGEYPTKFDNYQLNQIDILKNRYPNVPIGYSTHEDPNQLGSIVVALSKGITIAEKHVSLDTEKYPINAYSVTPEQLDDYLGYAVQTLEMCGGNEKHIPSEKEIADLRQFKRGAFLKRDVKSGDTLTRDDFYYAWPNVEGQMLANVMSKYNEFKMIKDIKIDQPLMFEDLELYCNRDLIWEIYNRVRDLIQESGVVVPNETELEISHHYGIDKFYKYGLSMITTVNREYCKKLLIALPGQEHPEQYHKQKEETFVLLYGDAELYLNGEKTELKIGEAVTIKPWIEHEFYTKNGCVIEEISSTHYKDDSFYVDDYINDSKNRKTIVKFRL